ncbi:glycine-rich protein [Trifolium repens]|nr:glycine-rich protein [Trifolium repens]
MLLGWPVHRRLRQVGGRGATCVSDNTKLPDDVWGCDAINVTGLAGSPRAQTWMFLGQRLMSLGVMGVREGLLVKNESYGGEGGGRISFEVVDTIDVSGDLLAIKGGGGSGGSIYIKAHRMTGTGTISATGGGGFAGGGGGRISIHVFSRHDNTDFFIHGGVSLGCAGNAGAAGTYYDAVPRSLTVGGLIRLTTGAVLSFGLAHYSSSEFELMAEELLMSNSVIKIFGALRMSVKIHLMLNSKILIDTNDEPIVATSLLEASNLVVLKESSIIHSNANLGVHGQGFLNLSGPGNLIEAQHLVLSLFYSINVGPGSVLRGPLEAAADDNMTRPSQLYCEHENCPVELLHPSEDCNVNSSLAFTLQICRVEDVSVKGTITGSVVHFHWVRSVEVESSGVISASGLGCTGGLGKGRYFENGIGGGGGHGGYGGDGYYNGNFIEGVAVETGNDTVAGATAGGGIIVMGSLEHSLSSLTVNGSLRSDGESSGEGRMVGCQALALVEALVELFCFGDEYITLASVEGSIITGGGYGGGQGLPGKNGSISGKACPKGLYGIFCEVDDS